MESDENSLLLWLLLVAVISISLAEPLQKIEKSIKEFSDKLISFLISPIFIFYVVSLCLIGFILLIIFKYKSYTEHKRWEARRREEVKKVFKIKKIYPKKSEEKLGLGDEEPEKEENSNESMLIGTYRRSVTIRVDEHKRYFHKKDISKDDVEYLLNKDYQIKKYKNLLSDKMEDFLLQPRFNESFTHLFLTYNISEFLEKNGIETELFVTKKPDIVFNIKGKVYAIEIETGSIFSKIERMKEKLEVLKDYHEWFFVVTDRNKVKKYKKYGDAVDKRYVKQRLDKLIKTAKKPKNRTRDFRV